MSTQNTNVFQMPKSTPEEQKQLLEAIPAVREKQQKILKVSSVAKGIVPILILLFGSMGKKATLTTTYTYQFTDMFKSGGTDKLMFIAFILIAVAAVVVAVLRFRQPENENMKKADLILSGVLLGYGIIFFGTAMIGVADQVANLNVSYMINALWIMLSAIFPFMVLIVHKGSKQLDDLEKEVRARLEHSQNA